jgi:hypothetical protein
MRNLCDPIMEPDVHYCMMETLLQRMIKMTDDLVQIYDDGDE